MSHFQGTEPWQSWPRVVFKAQCIIKVPLTTLSREVRLGAWDPESFTGAMLGSGVGRDAVSKSVLCAAFWAGGDE